MSMVIGHNFTFSCSEDANQFVKFLRKEGISARIEPISQTSYSFIIRGRYENLQKYLTDCAEEFKSTAISPELNNTSTSSEDTTTDSAFSPEEKLEYLEEIVNILELLEKQNEHATKSLEGKKTGDIAFEPKFSEAEQSVEEIKAYMRFLYDNKILMDNGIFNFSDNILRYDTIKPVDEFDFSFSISPGLVPSDDILEKYDIFRIQKIDAEIDFTVRTGPEVIGRLDYQKLKEELESIGEDEDFVIHAVQSINLKRELVDHILTLLDESGAETIDDLAEELEMSPGHYGSNERAITSYEISYDFTAEVIEDLKKLDLIRMKGNKIKLNRK